MTLPSLQTILTKLRMLDWWIYAIAAAALVALLAAPQMPVMLWKVALVTAGVVIGYGADRALYYRAERISEAMDRGLFGAARLLCRAIIVLAVITGLTGGL